MEWMQSLAKRNEFVFNRQQSIQNLIPIIFLFKKLIFLYRVLVSSKITTETEKNMFIYKGKRHFFCGAECLKC